jgi:hypothetical protein
MRNREFKRKHWHSVCGKKGQHALPVLKFMSNKGRDDAKLAVHRSPVYSASIPACNACDSHSATNSAASRSLSFIAKRQ